MALRSLSSLLDATWIGELVRQGVILAVVMGWWEGTDAQQHALLSFLSLLVTGVVGLRTVSARAAASAGTSIAELKAVAKDPQQTMIAEDVDDY